MRVVHVKLSDALDQGIAYKGYRALLRIPRNSMHLSFHGNIILIGLYPTNTIVAAK